MQAYLDNNATTRPDQPVIDAIVEMSAEMWANPSSVHRFGQTARHRVELAREQICDLIGASPSELIFTSGATESNNLAINGLLAARPTRKTVITNDLEHSAVRQPCERLESNGYNILRLETDIDGLIDPEQLAEALDRHVDDVALVAVHWINNETGAIQPIQTIGELCRQRDVRFFTDATQAIGKTPCDAHVMPVDALSFSGHKFHGPKGAGGLYVRRGVGLVPQILGGPHERDRRGGTENTPGIVGLGVAAQLAKEFLATDGPQRGRDQRDRLENAIVEAVPDAFVISANAPRLWNTSNIGFPPLQSEAILLLLSEKGICAAAGAACASGSIEPSPVLLAQGVPEAVAHGSLRLSLCRHTTDEEIDYAIATIPGAIQKLKASMPVQ
ncbi:MAG: cysteine desulfurase family protein [Planctomycetota bacterium]|jgi:cysteine desulfurase